jgi:hypothetical protein
MSEDGIVQVVDRSNLEVLGEAVLRRQKDSGGLLPVWGVESPVPLQANTVLVVQIPDVAWVTFKVDAQRRRRRWWWR